VDCIAITERRGLNKAGNVKHRRWEIWFCSQKFPGSIIWPIRLHSGKWKFQLSAVEGTVIEISDCFKGIGELRNLFWWDSKSVRQIALG
jgi:hypothetical protein